MKTPRPPAACGPLACMETPQQGPCKQAMRLLFMVSWVPCFVGLTGVCRSALSSALTPAVSKRASRRHSQPPLGRLCERIIAGRPVICIATLNARSFYISDGLQATTAATAMSNNANSLNRRYSGALVSNCAIGFISSRRSERRTQQRSEDAPCLANIASTLLCVCGYFTARAALYSIKLVHSHRQMPFPFPQRVGVPHGNGNATKRLATDMKARATTLNPSQQEQRECALQASGTHCTWYFHLRRSGSRYAQALSSLHEVLLLV